MTSLNAPGFSISLLNASSISEQMSSSIDVYALLDAETTASAWVGTREWYHNKPDAQNEKQEENILVNPARQADPDALSEPPLPSITRDILQGACIRVLEVEDELTQYDALVGDGDCGETFTAGANGKFALEIENDLNSYQCSSPAILKALEDGTLDVMDSSIATLVRNIADILEDVMGGTIGACTSLILPLSFVRISAIFIS